jgi:hypothetical protein
MAASESITVAAAKLRVEMKFLTEILLFEDQLLASA